MQPTQKAARRIRGVNAKLNMDTAIREAIESDFEQLQELFTEENKFHLLFFVLYRLVLVSRQSLSGLIFSLILCFGGIFAFTIHTYFLKKGRNEFDQPVSKFIFIAVLIVSTIQLIIAYPLELTPCRFRVYRKCRADSKLFRAAAEFCVMCDKKSTMIENSSYYGAWHEK